MLRKVYNFIIFITLSYLLMGCNMLLTKVDEDKKWGNFLRTGEEKNNTGYTNYQVIDTNIINIQGQIILDLLDPDGDEKGRGKLYPGFEYREGILDIHHVIVSADNNYIYFYVALQNKDGLFETEAQWKLSLIMVFLAKPQAPSSIVSLVVNSPSDENALEKKLGDTLDSRLILQGMDVKYGIGVVGGKPVNLGAVWDVPQVFNDLQGGNGSQNITNLTVQDNVIFVPRDYKKYLQTGNSSWFSTVVAFKVPRVGDLASSGSWKLVLFTYGWEDYGPAQPEATPGFNGHLRKIEYFTTPNNPNPWIFGVNELGLENEEARVSDLLTTNDQIAILSRKTNLGSPFPGNIKYTVISSNEVPTITLP